MNVKAWLYTIIGIVGLLACIVFLCMRNNKLSKELANSRTNEIAYQQEINGLKGKSTQLTYTIGQLNNTKDSLNNELNKVRKELKIKDKEISDLAYIASQVAIKDTVTVKDTIFYKNVEIDTTLTDKWYDIDLLLKYPNIIGFNISVPSEKYIVTYYKKELLNPSNCKVINWFKKKTKIVEVEVVEKNPFIINKQQRFIKILE